MKIIKDAIRSILSVIPNKIIGSAIAEILSKNFFQKRLLTRMFEGALDLEITDDSCVLLENDKWVRLKELIKYPFIELAIEKVSISWPGFLSSQFIVLFVYNLYQARNCRRHGGCKCSQRKTFPVAYIKGARGQSAHPAAIESTHSWQKY